MLHHTSMKQNVNFLHRIQLCCTPTKIPDFDQKQFISIVLTTEWRAGESKMGEVIAAYQAKDSRPTSSESFPPLIIELNNVQ